MPNITLVILPESITGLTGDVYKLIPKDIPAIIIKI